MNNKDILESKKLFKNQIISLQNVNKEEYKFYFKENLNENTDCNFQLLHQMPSAFNFLDP